MKKTTNDKLKEENNYLSSDIFSFYALKNHQFFSHLVNLGFRLFFFFNVLFFPRTKSMFAKKSLEKKLKVSSYRSHGLPLNRDIYSKDK